MRVSHSSRSGQSLIEAIIAISLLTAMLVPLAALMIPTKTASASARGYTSAVFLAQEGLEGARAIAASSFASLADGTYGLSVSGGTYAFAGTSDVTGLFTRTILVETAARSAGVLLDTPGDPSGSLDTDTKKVTTVVRWTINGKLKSVTLSTFLTNWR